MALELAAAIAGLIALADVAVIKGSKYCSLYKNGISEIQGLLKETINLGGALYSLEKSVNLFNSLQDTDTSREEGRELNSLVYIEDCRKCLLELGDILDKIGPKDVSKWEKVKSSLKWPISASETREFAQKIQRLKSTILVGLEADSLEALCKLLSVQKSVQESLQRVEKEQQRVAKRKQEKALDDKLCRALDRISTYKSSKHEQMATTRHPGTAIWFRDCDGYNKWLREPNSALWFDGIPGAGKSVLTSAIIQDLQLMQNEQVALAYFYVEYSSHNSQRFHIIARSLLRQLIECSLASKSQLIPDIEKRLQYEGPDEWIPSDLKLESVLDSFKMVSKNFTTTMLVIDGIDECDITDDRRKLLQFISMLGESPHGSIKVIATSRSIRDIKMSLGSFANISIAATSTDVKLFVAAELEQRLRSEVEFYGIRLQDPGLKAEIISALVEKSNGMFQWVRAQLDTLSRISGDTNKRLALQNLPRDLPETYRRIMRRVDRTNRELVLAVMFWIYSETDYEWIFDLNLENLLDVVAHQINDYGIIERDLLLNCGSLIKLLPDSFVRFSHFSVWEFMTSSDETKEWYYISEESRKKFIRERNGVFFGYLGSCLWNGEGTGNCRSRHPARGRSVVASYFFRDDLTGYLDHESDGHDQNSFLMEHLVANFDLGVENKCRITLALNVLETIRDILDEFSPFFGTNAVSLDDTTGSELHIACFLGFHEPALIRWCIKERQCDPGYRIMGGITAAHVLLARLLLGYDEVGKIEAFVWGRFAETWDLVTPEVVDYPFLFLLSEIRRKDGIFYGDKSANSERRMLESAKDNFKLWILSQSKKSTVGLEQVHNYICQQLRYQFQSDSEIPLPAQKTEAFKDFIANYSVSRTSWEAVISCRDLFPDSGILQVRQWFEIILQGYEFRKFLSKLQQDPDEGILLSPYEFCRLIIDTEEFELLRRLLFGLEIGLVFTPLQKVELLESLLLSNPSMDDEKIKTPLVPTLGRVGILYFKSVFNLINQCQAGGFLPSGYLHTMHTRLHQYVRQYVPVYLNLLEKSPEISRTSFSWVRDVVEAVNADENKDFVTILSELSGLELDSFLDFVNIRWELAIVDSITDTEKGHEYTSLDRCGRNGEPTFVRCLKKLRSVQESASYDGNTPSNQDTSQNETKIYPPNGNELEIGTRPSGFYDANDSVSSYGNLACNVGARTQRTIENDAKLSFQDREGDKTSSLQCVLNESGTSSATLSSKVDDRMSLNFVLGGPRHDHETSLEPFVEGSVANTRLGLAIRNNQYDELRLLLRDNADRFYVDSEGKTYLHLLVENGDMKMLQIFLEEPIWWIDALRSPAEERAMEPLPVLPNTTVAFPEPPNTANSNIQFCLEVFAKGLAAVGASNNANGPHMEGVVNQLNQLALSTSRR
ncbi:hypothetical protein TWF281_007496 [Arthrobotrys megalospora]